MNAVANRPRAAKAKPIDTAPAGKLATPEFNEDDVRIVLQRASSISCFLMNIFGHGAMCNDDDVRDLEGLMGAVQHLRRILKDMEFEVMMVDGDLPPLFRKNVTEASHLAALFDEIERRSGYKFHMGDFAMSAYFDAICSCCDDAIAMLEEEVVQSWPA